MTRYKSTSFAEMMDVSTTEDSNQSRRHYRGFRECGRRQLFAGLRPAIIKKLLEKRRLLARLYVFFAHFLNEQLLK